MMAGSAFWLEHEVRNLIVGWLGRLTEWTPFRRDGDRGVCLTCVRSAEQFDLVGTPHSMLHPIAASIDELVSHCFLTLTGERYSRLIDVGWSIAVDGGNVRVTPPDAASSPVSALAPAVAALHRELAELYTGLHRRATLTVREHHADIAAAVRGTVEPVVCRLAAELIDEVCGSAA